MKESKKAVLPSIFANAALLNELFFKCNSHKCHSSTAIISLGMRLSFTRLLARTHYLCLHLPLSHNLQRDTTRTLHILVVAPAIVEQVGFVWWRSW